MPAIAWLGSSPHWTPHPPHPDGSERFLFPLIEEHVLEAAFGAHSHLRRLSQHAALNVTSKYRMRMALQSVRLNPRWQPFAWFPGVIKAPASVCSEGTRTLSGNEHITRLSLYAPGLARVGVVEEFVPGPQYEIDGVVLGGKAQFFTRLRQDWDDENALILRYVPVADDAGFTCAAVRAVQALGLDDCPFCLEMRRSRDREWVVIDAHARLGEDEGLADVMRLRGGDDRHPLSQIEEWARTGTGSGS